MRLEALTLVSLLLLACGGPDGHDTPEASTPVAFTRNYAAPHKVNSDGDWAAAAPGFGFVCATKRAGSLWCAGDNRALQFGVGAPEKSATFVRVGEQYWAELAVSISETPFVCGITRGNRLACWGTPPGAREPISDYLDRSSGWRAVAAGATHACGIASDGMYCWGSNEHHELGISGGARSSPTRVTSGDWSAVGVGVQHACAIRTDGTLWCWGAAEQAGANGQSPDVPTRISAATTWVALAAGAWHTCALRTDGTLWCWGNAESGQLGVGVSNRPSTTPLQTGSAHDWAQVTSGANHTCARKTNDKLYCWGDGNAGQLGTGTSALRDAPTAVAGTYDWVSVQAYGNTTCGVRIDGGLWCWGRIPDGLHD